MKVFLAVCLILCLTAGCAYFPPSATESALSTKVAGSTAQTQSIHVTESTADIPPVTEEVRPEDGAFVRILDYIPDAIVSLKYATADNFTGQVIYSFSDAYLRYGTVKKLMAAQEALKSQGYCLKIWDAFRPVSGQQALWDAFPDPNYVSDPATGSSSHCRGNTVDITLIDEQGKELEMPTAFDDFTAMADRDYSDCAVQAAANAKLLEDIMYANGFRGYQKEWWHFTDLTDYEIEYGLDPAAISA